jgi:hypothetical protein
MELPTAHEKRPMAHEYKFTETNKMVPTDLLWLIAFFKQCQTANKAAGVLDKIKKNKHLKVKKTSHLPIACSWDSS